MANLIEEEDISLHIVELIAGDHFRYLLNFNIPVAIVQRGDRYTEALERVKNYINLHFMPQPENCVSCTFQITATYILQRPDLSERQWTGSFLNSSDQRTVLSGDGFRHFISNLFVNFVKRCTTDENVMTTLDWQDNDTQYSFGQLLSIIISFQVVIRKSDTRFRRQYGFGSDRGDRNYKQRVQVNNW